MPPFFSFVLLTALAVGVKSDCSANSSDLISTTVDFATAADITTNDSCDACRSNCEADAACVAYSYSSTADPSCRLYHNKLTLETGQSDAVVSGILYSHIATNYGFTVSSANLLAPYVAYGYADDNDPVCRSLCLKDPNCAAYQQPSCQLSTLSDQFEQGNGTVHVLGSIRTPVDPVFVNLDDIKTDLPPLDGWGRFGGYRSQSKIYAGTSDVVYYIDVNDSETRFGTMYEEIRAGAVEHAEFLGPVTNLKYVVDSFNPPQYIVVNTAGDVLTFYGIIPYNFVMDVTQCNDNSFKFNLVDGDVKPEYGKVVVLTPENGVPVCDSTVLNGDFVEFDMAACGIEFMEPKLYVYHADRNVVGLSSVYNVTCSPDYISVDVEHSLTDSLANTDYNHVVNEAVFNIDLLVLDQETDAPLTSAPQPNHPLKLVSNITDGFRSEFDLRITRCYVNGYMFYDNEGPLNDMTEVAQDIDNASQYINFRLFFPPTNQIINSLTYECTVATCWESCDPATRRRRSIRADHRETVLSTTLWWTHKHGR